MLFSATFTAQAQEKILISRLPGSASLINRWYGVNHSYFDHAKIIPSSAGQDTIMVDGEISSISTKIYEGGFSLNATFKGNVVTFTFKENLYDRRIRGGGIRIIKSDGTNAGRDIIQMPTTSLGGLAYGNGNEILSISPGGGMSRFEVESNAVAVTSSKPWLRASIKDSIVTVEFDDNFGNSQRGAEVVMRSSIN